MEEINNLIYSLKINFANRSGGDTSISVEIHDNGLKIKSIKLGNVCITEETINGRVLSGRIDNKEGCGGYRFDYQNGENLININPNIPIDTAISLINTSKRQSDYLTAELVLSSIARNDYRVVILDKGVLDIIKTVFAKNETGKQCCLQETLNLVKSNNDECFVEHDRKRVYMVDDKSVDESQARVLSDIISKSPQSCKELIEIKNQIQKNKEMV